MKFKQHEYVGSKLSRCERVHASIMYQLLNLYFRETKWASVSTHINSGNQVKWKAVYQEIEQVFGVLVLLSTLFLCGYQQNGYTDGGIRCGGDDASGCAFCLR